MTSQVIDLTQLGQFHIITYPKVHLSSIIYDLTYLIFLFNFYNQFFESTFWINFCNQSIYIELVASLVCNTLPF